ncbi:hypothetical protein KQI41_00535 [Tissierella pigra]|uniref:Uncharacterized protein n=1 Tax=Tissierella pigra TaxID=2607614 RepID=A0A6N7XGL0_9FIRM|nr:hypothetical protein [Tissierella pigra]MBU5424879.1 hypothetical protein [Tissierella pigra]MSU01181.1 hypothetical protein [Tissierella pigra]
MNDKKIEQILDEIGKEEIKPSQDIVDDTISFIKNRDIYFIIAVSIISYIVLILGTTVLGYNLGLKVTVFLLCIIHFIGLIPTVGAIIIAKNNKEGECHYEK